MKTLMMLLLLIGTTAIAAEPIPPDSDKGKFARLYALSLTGTIEGSGEQENLRMHGVTPAVAQKLQDHIGAAIKDINVLAAANQAATCKAEDAETLAALLDQLDADTDARMQKAVHDLPQVFGAEDATRLVAAAGEVHMEWHHRSWVRSHPRRQGGRRGIQSPGWLRSEGLTTHTWSISPTVATLRKDASVEG